MSSPVFDALSAVLIVCGALLALSSSIGLARFRDTVSRMHAVAKPQTLGLILTVTGAIMRIVGLTDSGPEEKGDIGVLLLIIAFTLITAPVIAQRVGRIARKERLYDKKALSRDDTADK
ncbi:monovalent cation/H(+) antiporter subunit G [Corynebacterium mendelii]|uniref:Monovalent cation/H(+) antiporter subunit G n=1 Tax=Corynebacterium mendelii TaxID=2765362 RepID=A0A939IY37_9CORY|nr:monovalent cation/H(+) antiporter subunit G [Corynebacterium mendelii]MBN9645125.1 monovalent cation/H(+) antiporter subunit G [Corynebacterium mendelii]